MGYLKNGEKYYFLEVFGAVLLFMAVNWLKRMTGHSIANPALLLTVNLLPVLPILLMALALARFYGHRDEQQRQIMLRTSGAGMLLAFTMFLAWPFLSPIGFPSLTAKVATLVLGICYCLCGLAVSFVNYRAESGLRDAALRMSPTFCFLAMMVVVFAILHVTLPRQAAPSLWGLLWMCGVGVAFAIYRLLKNRLDP